MPDASMNDLVSSQFENAVFKLVFPGRHVPSPFVISAHAFLLVSHR
jgi:hypothetical protein